MLAAAGCTSGGGGRTASDDAIGETRGPGERPILFSGAGGLRLSGTLTVPPQAAGGKVAAVLFVPPLGPGDRDGPIQEGGVPDRLYLDLATELVVKGAAVFRYDRRGSGQSRLEDLSTLTFDDVVADVRAAVGFVAERAEVDPARITVVAYDTAGLAALREAGDDRRVARLVLLSAPGRPLVDVLGDRLRARYGAGAAGALRSVVDRLVATSTLPSLDAIPSESRQFFSPLVAPYWARAFAVDPVTDAARVKVPVLEVVSGVTPGASKLDADRLAAAIGPSAEILVTPTAGPTLQTETRTSVVDASDTAAGTGHEHDVSAIPSTSASRQAPVVARIVSFVGV